jgi:acyl-CoA synthetase (AMP-forming)/AMP-acid ligase II
MCDNPSRADLLFYYSQVPSILAAIAANPFLLEAFDLSSVRSVVTGAAPLNKELLDKLHLLLPNWQFQHAWGKFPLPNVFILHGKGMLEHIFFLRSY